VADPATAERISAAMMKPATNTATAPTTVATTKVSLEISSNTRIAPYT
jgi:hypothetical protein